MVNLTQWLCIPRHYKNMTPDSYWKKRQIFKMSAHYYGRGRNLYPFAIRRFQRALQYVTKGRDLRKEHTREVWEDRITAGLQEFGHIPKGSSDFLESLIRANIFLNRQSIANLAIWEPRTFKSLSKIAAVKAKEQGVNSNELGPPPKEVFTRGKL